MTHCDRGWQLQFVDKIKSELGVKAMHRKLARVSGTDTLREPSEAYGGHLSGANDALKPDKTIRWEDNADSAQT